MVLRCLDPCQRENNKCTDEGASQAVSKMGLDFAQLCFDPNRIPAATPMTHGGPATFGTAGAKWSGTTKLTGIYPDNKQWPAKMAIVRTQIAELFDSELLSSPGQNFQSRVKRAYRPVGHDGSV